ncbi:MAG: cation diffusion facilitator family transporter, partial [Dehalococcoidia bacterium]
MTGAPVRIAAISLAITASLLIVKLVLGLISNSIAVLSDAVDSGTDLAGGAAALISVRVAAQPADREHPFGHGKSESISAAVAATVIAIGGGFVTYQAISRLIGGSPDINVGVGLIAVTVALVANIVVGFFMRREARRSDSMALRAEATHLTTNVVQAGAIIVGLSLVAITDEKTFDPIVALGLAVYMAYTAVGLIRTAVNEMMDMALPPEDIRAICDVLLAHRSEVRGFHRLRTRRSGSERHVDMHIMFDADMSVEESHHVADAIDHEIHTRLPGSIVVIHVEPDVGQEKRTLEELVAELASGAV